MNVTYDSSRQVSLITGGCAAVEYLIIGMIDNNTYLVDDGDGGVIVVDPSAHPETIMKAVGNRPVSAFFVTHSHWDHVGALAALHDRTGSPVYTSVLDAPLIESPQLEGHRCMAQACPVDRKLSDGDIVSVGKTAWKAILTPGHTPGGLCFYLDPNDGTDPAGAPLLLSGDTLFYGSIGRTDFIGGSMAAMRTSLRRLSQLPDETIVMPGHNSMTTIGAERVRVIEAMM